MRKTRAVFEKHLFDLYSLPLIANARQAKDFSLLWKEIRDEESELTNEPRGWTITVRVCVFCDKKQTHGGISNKAEKDNRPWRRGMDTPDKKHLCTKILRNK